MYYDWWVGKWCMNASQPQEKPELVLDVELIGPPSFVYGDVYLVFSGNKKRMVIPNHVRTYNGPEVFRPRKKDVIALSVEEYREYINKI